MRLRPVLFGLSILGCAALSGCAGLGVQPWERDLHARADMRIDAMDTGFDEHIYFSKEASSGGRGYGGGGCGCN